MGHGEMSRSGALRGWVLAWTVLAGISPVSAQEATGRIKLYQSSAAQYREQAGQASGERRDCLLRWAAYYDALAANLRTGSPAIAKPKGDSECKRPGQQAKEPDPEPQPVTPPIRQQSPAAELFDGLRYDMVQGAGAAKAPAPETRTKLDALNLILDDVTGAAPERRPQYLEEFLTASTPVVNELPNHPYKVGLLSLRTAALLELNRVDAARTSARQLADAGAAKSEGPTLRQFMATLTRQGWLAPGNGAPAAAQAPAPATMTPTVANASAAAVQDPNSLAGSIWSGTLVALNRYRKEVARYDMDIHFKDGGVGKAIYRETNPTLAWTQTGTRAAVKMELVAGCVLSLDLVSEGGKLNGVGSWSKIPGDPECVKAAGGITSGTTLFTRQTSAPTEFTATRVAFAPKSARPVNGKPVGAARNEPVAVTRVAPTYPPKAEQLSLEGWVVVVFTVAGDGSVKDAKVRESTSNLFDEAALAAVSQWRYKPLTTKKGVATEQPGVSVIISFKIPD